MQNCVYRTVYAELCMQNCACRTVYAELCMRVVQEPEHTCPLFSCRVVVSCRVVSCRRVVVSPGDHSKWRNKSYTPVKIVQSTIKSMTSTVNSMTSDQMPPQKPGQTIFFPFRHTVISRSNIKNRLKSRKKR